MDAEHVKIPVGISSCLLGERVRYDGGHKKHSYIMHTLGAYFEFKAFCPELSIGLGVPRKTIRLIRSDSEVRCVESNDISKDYTDRMKGCEDLSTGCRSGWWLDTGGIGRRETTPPTLHFPGSRLETP